MEWRFVHRPKRDPLGITDSPEIVFDVFDRFGLDTGLVIKYNTMSGSIRVFEKKIVMGIEVLKPTTPPPTLLDDFREIIQTFSNNTELMIP